eukprot:366285-Chlamydomonas_euryale.AAC.7
MHAGPRVAQQQADPTQRTLRGAHLCHDGEDPRCNLADPNMILGPLWPLKTSPTPFLAWRERAVAIWVPRALESIYKPHVGPPPRCEVERNGVERSATQRSVVKPNSCTL